MRSHAQVRILAYASRSRSVDSFVGGVPQQLLGAAAVIVVQYTEYLCRPRNSDTPGNTLSQSLHTHVTPISHCDSLAFKDLNRLLATNSLRWLAGWVLAGLPINRPLSLFGLTANMAEYTIPQVKPLAKIAGDVEQQIDFNFAPEIDEKYEIDPSEAAFWAQAADALDTRPKEEKGLTKDEVESLREENRRLKRTLIERFEMQMGQ